jgi:hypothetical protein
VHPPRVIGTWEDAELPIGFGYGARLYYGAKHPTWDDELERTLKSEWAAARIATGRAWDDVKQHVRSGYEYPR